MTIRPVSVTWEIAADPELKQVVRSGTVIASVEVAHSVHVEVEGLESAREYFYRFRAGDAESPVGRVRTLPAPGAEGRGLLQRRRTKEDARAYAVKLTDEGREVLRTAEPLAGRVDRRVLEALPVDRREEFMTALASIVSALGGMGPRTRVYVRPKFGVHVIDTSTTGAVMM